MLTYTKGGRRFEIDGPPALEMAFAEALAAHRVELRWEDEAVRDQGDLPSRGSLMLPKLTANHDSFRLEFSGTAVTGASIASGSIVGNSQTGRDLTPADTTLASGHVGSTGGNAR